MKNLRETAKQHNAYVIDPNSRVFMLVGDMGKTILCNIEDFERAWNEFTDKDSVKIQHKWNGRFVKCSKKSVTDMLQAMRIEYTLLNWK